MNLPLRGFTAIRCAEDTGLMVAQLKIGQLASCRVVAKASAQRRAWCAVWSAGSVRPGICSQRHQRPTDRPWERLDRVKEWRHDHRFVFRDIESDEQLAAAKAIANKYPAYGLDMNQLGDLEVMALAKARGLTVVTLESTKQHSQARPKIPNVCGEFGIEYMGLKDFLREEGGTEIGVSR